MESATSTPSLIYFEMLDRCHQLLASAKLNLDSPFSSHRHPASVFNPEGLCVLRPCTVSEGYHINQPNLAASFLGCLSQEMEHIPVIIGLLCMWQRKPLKLATWYGRCLIDLMEPDAIFVIFGTSGYYYFIVIRTAYMLSLLLSKTWFRFLYCIYSIFRDSSQGNVNFFLFKCKVWLFFLIFQSYTFISYVFWLIVLYPLLKIVLYMLSKRTYNDRLFSYIRVISLKCENIGVCHIHSLHAKKILLDRCHQMLAGAKLNLDSPFSTQLLPR
jgi:hypothetical protein